MAKKPRSEPAPTGPAHLRGASRARVEELIREQVREGERLLTMVATSDFSHQRDAWDLANRDLLERYFTTAAEREPYDEATKVWFVGMRGPSAEDRRNGIQKRLTVLQSVLKRLPQMDDLASAAVSPSLPRKESARAVFIVHGHDEAAKEKAARLVSAVGLTPIILQEQPNKGRTIIEKFESHAADAGFAIVLLTGDDRGAAQADGTEELKARARQNVVFEFGFFVHALGRSRVCAVYKDGVELPSDVGGLLYVKMEGAWRYQVAAELKQVFPEVDLNNVPK